MLRAIPIEIRDEGIVWQMPDGSVWTQSYKGQESDPPGPKKKKAPPKENVIPKNTILHDAIELLHKRGAMRTAEISRLLGRHRNSVRDALLRLEAGGNICSRVVGADRIWRITTTGMEYCADLYAPRVRGPVARKLLGIVARAHGPISTLTVIDRAAGYGLARKNVKWTLEKMRDRGGLVRTEKRNTVCGLQTRALNYWSLTEKGREAYRFLLKTERRAA